MSLMTKTGTRHILLSFLEMVLFFLLVTPLFFIAMGLICSGIVNFIGLIKLGDFWNNLSWSNIFGDFWNNLSSRNIVSVWLVLPWLGALPVWMWIVDGVGYLGLVTLYWVPGDDAVNQTERRAFALFLLIALVAFFAYLLRWHASALRAIFDDFWNLVTGKG